MGAVHTPPFIITLFYFIFLSPFSSSTSFVPHPSSSRTFSYPIHIGACGFFDSTCIPIEGWNTGTLVGRRVRTCHEMMCSAALSMHAWMYVCYVWTQQTRRRGQPHNLLYIHVYISLVRALSFSAIYDTERISHARSCLVPTKSHCMYQTTNQVAMLSYGLSDTMATGSNKLNLSLEMMQWTTQRQLQFVPARPHRVW